MARGERREICRFTGNVRGGSWSATGSIVFATTNPQSLMRVPSQGGKPAPIRLSGTEDHLGPISWPSFLPDGRRFLYSVRTKAGAVSTIHLASIESDTDVRRVVASDTQAVFVAPGYLLFGRDTRLLHQAFDVETGQVSGDAVAVVDRLRMMTQIAFGEFSASNTGMLAYRSGLDASNQFTWVDRKGASQGTVGAPGRYRTSSPVT